MLLVKLIVLIALQLLFIYLFSIEQNVQLQDVFFPFGIIMLIISVLFTFVINGMDVKQKGIRFIGAISIKDEPTKNEGPYKMSLVNSFTLSAFCVFVISTFFSLI